MSRRFGTVRALLHWNVLRPRLLVIDLKFESCVVHARTSNELKISIEAARLACPETKDETHRLSLPLSITLAEFDPVDQRVRSGMSAGSISETELPFLDINLRISGDRIRTSIHYKATDTHSFLHYDSSHPPTAKVASHTASFCAFDASVLTKPTF